MSLPESQDFDRKSLAMVTGKTANWKEVAKDAVAFAAARGGRLLIGIEDGQDLPPAHQVIPVGLADQVRKRLRECTVNVEVIPTVVPGGAMTLSHQGAKSRWVVRYRGNDRHHKMIYFNPCVRVTPLKVFDNVRYPPRSPHSSQGPP